MRLALVGWRGTGTDLDPFRPDCDPAGTWGVFDLRSDVTAAAGRGVLLAPDDTAAIPGALRDLGDDLDLGLSAAQAQWLENQLGITIDTNRDPRRIIRKLMLEGGGSGRWNAIRAEASSWYRGWMAGVKLFEVPQVGGGATFTENFTRADGTTIGNLLTWSETTGDVETSGNRVRAITSGNNARARAQHDCDTVDMYAEADFEYTSGSGHNWFVCCRWSSSVETFYRNGGNSGASSGLAVQRTVNGSSSTIGSAQTFSTSTNTPWRSRIEADGSTITATSGATSYAQSDSNIDGVTSGGRRGGFAFLTSVPSALYADDFEMGDLVAPGHPARRRWVGLPFAAGPRSTVRRG